MMPNPADEPGYYANLTDFLAGDFSRRWHFTIGTSLFYLPFELLSGTRNLTDILLSALPVRDSFSRRSRSGSAS